MIYGLGSAGGDARNYGSKVQPCPLQRIRRETAGSTPVQARQELKELVRRKWLACSIRHLNGLGEP